MGAARITFWLTVPILIYQNVLEKPFEKFVEISSQEIDRIYSAGTFALCCIYIYIHNKYQNYSISLRFFVLFVIQ